jgi:hypothetical protein
VRLRVTFFLTLVGNPVREVVQPGGRPANVPGVGLCSVGEYGRYERISCATPLRDSPNVLLVTFPPGPQDLFRMPRSYSPLPADSSMSPLHRYSWAPGGGFPAEPPPRDLDPVNVVSLTPLAHFRRYLDLHGVVLSDYLPRRIRTFGW